MLDINMPIIEVSSNQLILSIKAIELINANYGDRIAINYLQINNKSIIPVIGKAEVFINPNAGNKLTKRNTISFKGMQKTTLSKLGILFKIEAYRDGMFKMIAITNNNN